MIDVLAEFARAGIISQNGKINRDLAGKTNRVREGETGWEYVLCWKDETQLDQDLVVMRAGHRQPDPHQGVDLRGLFGAAQERRPAVHRRGAHHHRRRVRPLHRRGEGHGHRPAARRSTPEIVTYGGNTSLTGCKLASLFQDKMDEVEAVATMITNIELSRLQHLHGRVRGGPVPAAHADGGVPDPRRAPEGAPCGGGRTEAGRGTTMGFAHRGGGQGRDREDDRRGPDHPPPGGTGAGPGAGGGRRRQHEPQRGPRTGRLTRPSAQIREGHRRRFRPA